MMKNPGGRRKSTTMIVMKVTMTLKMRNRGREDGIVRSISVAARMLKSGASSRALKSFPGLLKGGKMF